HGGALAAGRRRADRLAQVEQELAAVGLPGAAALAHHHVAAPRRQGERGQPRLAAAGAAQLGELATDARQRHAAGGQVLHHLEDGEVLEGEAGRQGGRAGRQETGARAASDGGLGQAGELRRVASRVYTPHVATNVTFAIRGVKRAHRRRRIRTR